MTQVLPLLERLESWVLEKGSIPVAWLLERLFNGGKP